MSGKCHCFHLINVTFTAKYSVMFYFLFDFTVLGDLRGRTRLAVSMLL